MPNKNVDKPVVRRRKRVSVTVKNKNTEYNTQIGEKTSGWPVMLTVPIPMSLNQMWRKGKYGQTYLRKEGKEYKKTIRDAIKNYMEDNGIDISENIVILRLCVFWPDITRKRDQGNVEKLTSDALTGILYRDDYQVFPQFVPPHRADPDNPRVEILASEWDGVDIASASFNGYTTNDLGLFANKLKKDASDRKEQGLLKRKMTLKAKKENKINE